MAENVSLSPKIKLDLSSINYCFNNKNYTYKYTLDYKLYANICRFMFNYLLAVDSGHLLLHKSAR